MRKIDANLRTAIPLHRELTNMCREDRRPHHQSRSMMINTNPPDIRSQHELPNTLREDKRLYHHSRSTYLVRSIYSQSSSADADAFGIAVWLGITSSKSANVVKEKCTQLIREHYVPKICHPTRLLQSILKNCARGAKNLESIAAKNRISKIDTRVENKNLTLFTHRAVLS